MCKGRWSKIKVYCIINAAAAALNEPFTRVHNHQPPFTSATLQRIEIRSSKKVTEVFFRHCILSRRLEETAQSPSDYMDEDSPKWHEFRNLTLTESVNMAQNRPPWKLLAASGATHSYWCCHRSARQKWWWWLPVVCTMLSVCQWSISPLIFAETICLPAVQQTGCIRLKQCLSAFSN